MKGRKPKPTAQRVLQGNPSKRPINLDEPRPPAPAPEFDAVPRELLGHDDAIAEWIALAPMLRKAGQITIADRSVLVACCLEWDAYLVATRAAQREVANSKAKYRVVSPHRTVARQALVSLLKLWPELGLTPSSRARMHTTPLSPLDDPFTEFDQPPTTTQ